jgi:regulator of protease activity HflC (stomatin/prohibitin superfamily)
MTGFNTDSLVFLGFVAGLALLPVAWMLLKLVRVEVGECEAVLVTRFGRLSQTMKNPGWHWLWDRSLPWVSTERVSLRREFQQSTDVVVNDSRGTTVIVDIWLEVRVVDPMKAKYAVDDWNGALRQLVGHAVTSILAGRTFEEILADRSELARLLCAEIKDETARWGIVVELAFLQRVSLLPELSERMFSMIGARLERCKADIEEEGHQRVQMLDAETTKSTAQLVAQAKGQYLAAVGRALAALKASPPVFTAFQQLYELSQLRPHRMLTFKGFKDGEVRAFDAAMFAAMGSPEAPGPSPVASRQVAGPALDSSERRSARPVHDSREKHSAAPAAAAHLIGGDPTDRR